jgi:muramidase (phage lysozyme)
VAKLGLADFGPENQDCGAIELIHGRGAFELIEAARVAGAIHKCCEERVVFRAAIPGSAKMNSALF